MRTDSTAQPVAVEEASRKTFLVTVTSGELERVNRLAKRHGFSTRLGYVRARILNQDDNTLAVSIMSLLATIRDIQASLDRNLDEARDELARLERRLAESAERVDVACP